MTAVNGADEGVLLRLSEVFESIQGEGASAGESCVFVRLALCNLHCSWCDTKYTWDWDKYDYTREVRAASTSELARHLTERRARRVVLTGGEPMLQQRALAELCAKLGDTIYFEVETNGTIAPVPELAARIDQWNVSPKLAHAGDPRTARIRPKALGALAATRRAWLKLVVASDSDLVEADALVRELEWPFDRVLLMPEAATRVELRARLPLVTEAARARGYGVSPRLHVERWDGLRGV
jgi:organic radical activating enzyme